MYLHELPTRVAAHVSEYQHTEERLPMSLDKLRQPVRVHPICSNHSRLNEDKPSGDA
jgi:hypothetical protein